jgi:small subunit ribosomal protein S17
MAEETEPQPTAETPAEPRAQVANVRRSEKVGRVVSTGMQKTIVVQVTRRVRHPLYGRVVQRRKKFYAHDEKGECRVGDVVRIVESRPLSRLKRWRLREVLHASTQAGLVEPADVPVGAPEPQPPETGAQS